MALLAEMKEAKEAPVVGYTEFSIAYKVTSTSLYCFFEAIEDIRYYTSIIRNVSGNPDVIAFRCRNKDGVLKVYSLVKARDVFKDAKTGYFIDRDFDPRLNNEEIYETPFYSIENFYVVSYCLENIFYEHFQIPRGSPDMELCLSLYNELQDEFHQRTLSINAYLSCHADARSRGACPSLNIDSKIHFKDCVSVDLKEIIGAKDLTFEELEGLFDTPGVFLKADFDLRKMELSKTNMVEVFRGKFELQFLESFLKRFNAQVSKRTAHLCTIRYKTNLQIFLDTIITLFNSNAYVPLSLRDYIFRIAA